MKRIIFVTALSCFAVSCGKDTEFRPDMPTYENFVRRYIEPKAMSSMLWGEGNTSIDPVKTYASNKFWITFGTDTQSLSSTEYRASTIYKGGYVDKNRMFDSIALANGDIGYGGIYDFAGISNHRRMTNMEMVSDADYDTAHPAGTSLNDILMIEFWAADEFIANGFSYVGTGNRPDGSYVEPLDVFVSKQRRLIAFEFKATFVKGPDQTGSHRFTITYTNEDNVVLTTTTDQIKIGK